MGVHVANGHIKTSNKGLYRDSFRFNVGAAGAVGTIYQSGANFVTSVTKSAAGTYTVQLNQNYPVRVIRVVATVSAVAVNDAVRHVRYKAGSYSATTGQFVIFCSDNTPAAADPINGSEIHVVVEYVAQTTGVAN